MDFATSLDKAGSSLVNTISGTMKGVCEAGMEVQFAALDRILNYAFDEKGELKMMYYRYNSNIAGQKRFFELGVPFISLLAQQGLMPTSGNAKFRLEINDHYSDKKNTKVDASLKATVSGGWAVAKASVEIGANVSHSSERVRTSDKSAEVLLEVQFGRVEFSSGISKLQEVFLNLVVADIHNAHKEQAGATHKEISQEEYAKSQHPEAKVADKEAA